MSRIHLTGVLNVLFRINFLPRFLQQGHGLPQVDALRDEEDLVDLRRVPVRLVGVVLDCLLCGLRVDCKQSRYEAGCVLSVEHGRVQGPLLDADCWHVVPASTNTFI